MVVFGFSKVISFEMEQGSRACGVVSCPNAMVRVLTNHP